jgi:hypothetical protein
MIFLYDNYKDKRRMSRIFSRQAEMSGGLSFRLPPPKEYGMRMAAKSFYLKEI